jgi:hypothetical protein
MHDRLALRSIQGPASNNLKCLLYKSFQKHRQKVPQPLQPRQPASSMHQCHDLQQSVAGRLFAVLQLNFVRIPSDSLTALGQRK